MKKRLVVFAAALAAAAIAVTPAFADGTATWDGNGSQNLPCSGGEHWVLANAQDVTGAELFVDGVDSGAFEQHGQGAWSIDTDFGFDGTESVSAQWQGDGSPQLVLSHCDSGETTGGTTGETTGETSSGGTSSGGTSSGGTSSGGSSSGGTTAGTSSGGSSSGGTTGTGGVSGSTTGGTTGGSAATPSGGDLPFTGLPVWMPLLAAAAMLASGVFMIRRRKGEVS